MPRQKIDASRLIVPLSGRHVTGAWLFGSAEGGEVREGGDVDIAVLFERKPDLDELATLRERLQRALGFDNVDLVALNGASPILRYQALCGTRVFCARESWCARFASLTAREYEDEMAQCRRALRDHPQFCSS